jgi:circadian clock protein KaiB
MSNPEKYNFILVVSGMSSKSMRAIENIKKIGDQYLQGKYKLEIIDINRYKEQAEKYQIIAVPTLIKVGPQPSRTIVGDLSDIPKVLKILDLLPNDRENII